MRFRKCRIGISRKCPARWVPEVDDIDSAEPYSAGRVLVQTICAIIAQRVLVGAVVHEMVDCTGGRVKNIETVQYSGQPDLAVTISHDVIASGERGFRSSLEPT